MKNSPVQVQISPYPLIHSLNHKAHHRTPSAAGPPCPGTLVTTFPPPTLKPTRTERHTSTSKPDASYTPPTPPIFTPHLLHLPPPTPLRSAFSLRGAGAEAEQGHPQAGEQPRAVAPLEAAEDLRHVRLLDVEGVGASNEEGERDGGCAVGRATKMGERRERRNGRDERSGPDGSGLGEAKPKRACSPATV